MLDVLHGRLESLTHRLGLRAKKNCCSLDLACFPIKFVKSMQISILTLVCAIFYLVSGCRGQGDVKSTPSIIPDFIFPKRLLDCLKSSVCPPEPLLSPTTPCPAVCNRGCTNGVCEVYNPMNGTTKCGYLRGDMLK
jgi:hypothetical protein